MNPILVQHMADYKMDALDREAEARRIAALVRDEARSGAMRDLITRTASQLRLALRGVAA